jgi:hypothetical protein
VLATSFHSDKISLSETSSRTPALDRDPAHDPALRNDRGKEDQDYDQDQDQEQEFLLALA